MFERNRAEEKPPIMTKDQVHDLKVEYGSISLVAASLDTDNQCKSITLSGEE